MNDLYLTPVGMEQRQDPYELIIPESFEEALTYEEQILWLLAHKQDLLVEGDNITLTPNEDGTVTISSEGGQGATYTIETATPDEGYTAAYILKNVDTGQQAGVKIQVPTVAGPQGPQGVPGQDGQDGQDGTDGVGIQSIVAYGEDVVADGYIPQAQTSGDFNILQNIPYTFGDFTILSTLADTNGTEYSHEYQNIFNTPVYGIVALIPGCHVSGITLQNPGDTQYVAFAGLGVDPTTFDPIDFSIELYDTVNNVVVDTIECEAPTDPSALTQFPMYKIELSHYDGSGSYELRIPTTETASVALAYVCQYVLSQSAPAIDVTYIKVTLTNGTVTTFEIPSGAAGATGPQGATGPAGPGVPAGGTTGQFLVKSSSTDYDASWVTVPQAENQYV